MFKITLTHISSAIIAAHILLACFTSAEANEPRELRNKNRGGGNKPGGGSSGGDKNSGGSGGGSGVKSGSSGGGVKSGSGGSSCANLPDKIIEITTNTKFTTGYDYYHFWDEYGPYYSLQDVEVKPGNKFVWGGNPICAVKGYGDYYDMEDVTACADGTNEQIGSASGVCTVVSVDDYEKETHFDCLYSDVLHFESDYDVHFKGGTITTMGLKALPDQAVTGGTGEYKTAFGSIYKKAIKYKYYDYYVIVAWVYDLSHVVCDDI